MIETRANEFYSLFALILDANNVMILAPSDEAAVAPANYRSQEHIGNLCRAHAKVVACFMDNGTYSLDCSDSDCNEYVEGYGRTGYTGPTGRTGPCHDPPDPSAYSTHTALPRLAS